MNMNISLDFYRSCPYRLLFYKIITLSNLFIFTMESRRMFRIEKRFVSFRKDITDSNFQHCSVSGLRNTLGCASDALLLRGINRGLHSRVTNRIWNSSSFRSLIRANDDV